jgi:hypothetical protein
VTGSGNGLLLLNGLATNGTNSTVGQTVFGTGSGLTGEGFLGMTCSGDGLELGEATVDAIIASFAIGLARECDVDRITVYMRLGGIYGVVAYVNAFCNVSCIEVGGIVVIQKEIVPIEMEAENIILVPGGISQ